jgi:2'-5' RNA ligase
MIYALVHYPDVETRRINALRNKYDPQAGLIGPHITLMFPVPESVGEDELVRHLHTVLSGRRPFPLHLRGLQKSLDDYLFLLVQEGKTEIIGLHREIYTGLLADYRKEDAPFIPHVTLGVFAENLHDYDEALEEAKRLDLDCRCVLDKIHLVKADDAGTQIVWSKEFPLSA